MLRELKMQIALAFPSVVLVFGLGGCLRPPSTFGAASPTPAGDDAIATPNTAAPPANGVIWNGDSNAQAAKGWADCDKKPDCKAQLEPTPGAGKNGSVGLKFQGEGAGFVGMGWNWFGWYPETGGTNVSAYKNLTFSVRVVAASPTLAPDLAGTSVSLGCSKGKKSSASVAFSNYAKEVLDGRWHKVSVPLTVLQKAEGKELDLTTVWEFRIGTWSGSPRKFEVYVDDIAFEK
jgi:hypothetical protein